MKLSVVSIAVLAYSSFCTALPNAEEKTKRDTSGTCSIGIARLIGRTSWSTTIYNVAQEFRQDLNVIATLKNAEMAKGDSITVPGPLPITITNIDNAPAFDYDISVQNQSWSGPGFGDTKVELSFSVVGKNQTWTTETGECGAGSVVWSGGIESWSCDFECDVAAVSSEGSSSGYEL